MWKGLHFCLQAEISVMPLNGSVVRCVHAHPWWLILAQCPCGWVEKEAEQVL
jgi:hypothetical protein